MGTKAKLSTKVLSLFLSVLMAVSCFGIALPNLAPEAKAAGTDFQPLKDALLAAMNGGYLGTDDYTVTVDADGNASVNDTTKNGYLFAVVRAVGEIAKTEGLAEGHDHNATLAAYICEQVDANEFQANFITAILPSAGKYAQYDGSEPNGTWNGAVSEMNSFLPETYEFTTSVTRDVKGAVLTDYETAYDVPATVDSKYTVTFTGTRTAVDSTNGQETGAVYKNTGIVSATVTANAPDVSAIRNYLNFVVGERNADGEVTPSAFAEDYAVWLENPNSVYAGDPEILTERYNAFTSLHNAANALDTDYVEKFIGHDLMNSHLQYANAALAAAKTIVMKPYVDWINGVETADVAAFDGYIHRDNYTTTDRARMVYLRDKAQTYLNTINDAGSAVKALMKEQYGYLDTYKLTADTTPMPDKTYYQQVLVNVGTAEEPVAKDTYEPIAATAENISGLYERVDYETYITVLNNQIQLFDLADIRTAAQYLLSNTVADAPYVFPAGSKSGSYQAASGTAEAGTTYYEKDSFGFYAPKAVEEGASVAGLYEWKGAEYYGMGAKTYYSEDYIAAGEECPVSIIDLTATAAWFASAVNALNNSNTVNVNAVFSPSEIDDINQMKTDLNAEIAYRAFDDNSEAFRSEYTYFVNLKLNNDLPMVSDKVYMGYTEDGLDANNQPITVNVPGLIETAESHYTALVNAFNAIASGDAATRSRYQTFVNDARAFVNQMYQTLLDRSYAAYSNLYGNVGNSTVGNGISASNFTLVKGIIAGLDDDRDTPYTEAVENNVRNWLNSNRSTIVSKLGNSAGSTIDYINTVHNAIPNFISKCNTLMTGHWGAFGSRYYNDHVNYSGGANGSSGYIQNYNNNGNGIYAVRDGQADDMVRADNDKDYVVTESRVNSVITKLDNFAKSTDFVKMIGVYDTYDPNHSVTDLTSFIKSILEENLFTDDMVNTFVALLFPMLSDLIENKMITMLTGFLPGSSVIDSKGAFRLNLQTLMTTLVNQGTVDNEIPFEAVAGSSNWNVKADGWVRMSSLSGTVSVYMNGTGNKGIKTFKTVFDELGIKIWPSTLAAHLSARNGDHKYDAIIAKLNTLGDNWMNLDMDHDNEITKDDFELAKLTYGIKDYSTFITVMGDFLGAAGPLINTLFTNHNFDSGMRSDLVYVKVDNAEIYAHGGVAATAFGYSFGPSLSRTVRLGEAEAKGKARIQIDGMLGYNDLWVPIMEGLGITGYTNSVDVGTNENATNTLSKGLGTSGNSGTNAVVNGLFLPLMNLIKKVANKPIDTVLGMLPNLAYNIAYNNVTTLLDCLKTTLNVKAEVDDLSFDDVVIVDIIDWKVSLPWVGTLFHLTPNLDVTSALKLFMGKLTDAINGFLKFDPDLDIGGMIDLDSVLPFDITNLNDVVGFLLDKIGGDDLEGLTLPAINTAHLGRLGNKRDYTTSVRSYGHVNKGEGYDMDTSAHYIDADKADVLYELIDIVASFVKQTGALSGLLSGSGSGIGTLLEEIFKGVDTGKILASIVELFEPQVYKMAAYNWYQPNSTSSTFTFNDSIYNGTMAQGGFVYLKYQNQWSRDQATYMYDNLEKAVDDIFALINENSSSERLKEYTGFSDWLLKNVNKLFKNKNINGFIDALVDIAANLDSEGKTLPNMLKEQLKVGNSGATVDIYSWYYRFGYLNPELRILGTHEVADPESPTGVKTVDEVLYLDKNGNICVGYPETETVKINGTVTQVTEMHFVRTYPLAPSGFAGFRTDALTDELVPAASGSNLPGRYGEKNITYFYSPKYNTSHTKRYVNYDTCSVSADAQYSAASITISGHTFENKNKVSGLFNGVNPIILTEKQHEDDKDGNYVLWSMTGNANTAQFGVAADSTELLVDGHLGGSVALYNGETKAVAKARAVFFAIIASFFEPFAPAFSFVLNGQDLKLFNNALVIKGYDVYNGAIVPLLEASGIRDLLNSTDYNTQYGTNASGGFYYLANKVFTKLDDLLTDSSATGGKTPTQKIIDLLPGLYYYLQSDGLGTLVKNVVFPIWVLVDDVRPLLNVNLDLIIHGVAGKLLGVDTDAENGTAAQKALYQFLMSKLDIDSLLKKTPSDPQRLTNAINGLSLKKLTLKDMAELGGAFTGMFLKPLFYAFEGMCYGYTLNGTKYGTVLMTNSKHYDIATFNTNGSKNYEKTYTLSYLGPDTVTVTISALLDLLRYQGNAQALDELIGLARELLPGETLETAVTATGLLDGLEKVFAARATDNYTAPNWDYILEGKAVKAPDGNTIILWNANTDWQTLLQYTNYDNLKLHNKHDDVTKRALGYKTDWTRDTAVNMDTMFATLLDWLTTTILAKDDAEITGFEDYVNNLIDNELLGADTLKSLVGAISKLYQVVPASIIGIIDNLLGVDLEAWAQNGYFRPGDPNRKILDEKGDPELDDDGNEIYEKEGAYYVADEYKWWAMESSVQLDENGNAVLDPETGDPIEILVKGPDYVDSRDEFFDALTELLTPIAKLIGFIFLEDGYKFFYSVGDTISNNDAANAPAGQAVTPGDDVDAIILEGLGIWGKGLIPILEAMGIRKIMEEKGKNFNDYAPGNYLISQGNYNSAKFVKDLIFILRTFAEGVVADPVEWLLDNMPNIIYFVNANGIATCVKNIFDSVQDIIDMVNTRLEASERISTSNLAGINLSNLTLDGLFKLLERFTAWEEEAVDEDGNVILDEKGKPVMIEHPGLHVRDDLIDYIKDLYFGNLSHFISANGKDAFRMDALATNPNDPDESIEDRANFITVFVALVLEIVEDKGTFLDAANGYVQAEYDNPAFIDHLAKTKGLISQIIEAVKNPKDLVKYKDVNWFYFDDNFNIADATIDENNVVEVPGYLFQYLNYTTKWTYDKALATATGLEDMIVSILKFVDKDTYADLTGLGELINTDTFYNGELLQNLLDMLAKVLYGEDSQIPAQLLDTAGALLDADLTQWNRNYAFGTEEDFEGVTIEGEENGMSYATLPAKLPVYDEKGRQVTDEDGNKVYTEGDPIRTYLVNDRASFVAGATLMLQPAYRLLDWLLFNDSYEFFNGNTAGTENDILITLPGCEGYGRGLVLLLEALGCEGLKYPSFYEGVDEEGKPTVDTAAYVNDILTSVADRIDTICENPVDEIIGMIPELIYFINAGGLQVSVANLLAGPLALVSNLQSLADEDADEDDTDAVVNKLVGDAIDKALEDEFKGGVTTIGFKLDGINLQYIFSVVEAITGLEITDCVGNKLDRFYMGEIYRYNSMSGEGDLAYKMTFSNEEDFADFLTIMASLIIDVLLWEDDYVNNAEALVELIDLKDNKVFTADEMKAMIIEVIEFLKDNEYITDDPRAIDWLYFDENYSIYDDDDELKDPLPEVSPTTEVVTPVRFINYLSYASDWTDSLAHYIYNNRNALINSVLKLAKVQDKEVLGIKLGDIFNNGGAVDLMDKVYTAQNLNAILNGVKGLTEKVPDALFKLLYIVLDIDFGAYTDEENVNYIAPFDEEANNGVMTKDAFVDGLVKILQPLSTIIDWLLFGSKLQYFDKKTNTMVPKLDINGNVVTKDALDEDGNVILIDKVDEEGNVVYEDDGVTPVKVAKQEPVMVPAYEGGDGTIEILLEINGAKGYDYGLIPIMEALGINAPASNAVSTLQNMLPGILSSLLTRVEEILANPVDEILALLPNLLYFINSRGLITSVQNLLAGPMALIDRVNEKLDPDGTQPEKRVGINTVLNAIGFGENTDVDILKLDLKALFTLAEDLTAFTEVKKDADGNVVYKVDEEGNPVYELDEDGEIVYEVVRDEDGIPVIDEETGEVKKEPVRVPDTVTYSGVQIIKTDASDSTGFIDLDKIENFYFGKIELSESANGKVRGTMSYTEEEDAADMLTIIVNLAVEFALYSWGEGKYESNAAVLEKLLKLDEGTVTGILEALDTLGTEVAPGNYHWNYFNEIDDDFDNSDGYTETFYFRPKEQNLFMNYLSYDPGQSWTQNTADVLYQNIGTILDKVLTAVAKDDPEKAKTAGEMLSGSFDLYTGENLDAIVGYINKAYDYIDELVNLIGLVLGADENELTGWKDMTKFADLKDAQGNPVIHDRDSFRAGLVEIIKPLYPVLDWLLFGKNYEFFVKDENGNTVFVDGQPKLDADGNPVRVKDELITITGANGYAYALVPLLTILGVQLPACKVGEVQCGTETDGRTFLDLVIDAVLTRVDAILEKPVDEALKLLPQIVYFINANGLATMVENLLGAVKNAADVLVKNGTIPLPDGTVLPQDEETGEDIKPETIAEYVYDVAGINIDNLDLEGIIAFIETMDFMQGLKINEVFTVDFDGDGVKENILEYFYMGAGAERVVTSVTNADDTPYAIYKLRISDTDPQHPYVPGDILTTLLCIVLEVLMYENSDAEHPANAEPLAKIVNSFSDDLNLTAENIEALRTLLREGVKDPKMNTINWAYVYGYLFGGDETSEQARLNKIAEILSLDENALNALPERTVNYLTYDAKNNAKMLNLWSEDAVSYVDDNLNDIVDQVIAVVTNGESEDLTAFIKNNVDLFSDDTANMIVEALVNALGQLDELLGGDSATTDMILDTLGEQLGIENLSSIRTRKASGIKTKEAFVDFMSETFALVNPILDWILFGKEYKFFTKLSDGKPHTILVKGGEGYKYGLAPILDALGIETDLTTAEGETKLHKILQNVADRIQEILDNPIDEVLDLLPELIYFINADGLTVCFNNLIAPVDALLKEVGKNIGQDDLCLNKLIEAVDLDNLNFSLVYQLLKDNLGLILSDEDGEPIGKYLSTFYFGKLKTETIYDGLKVVHMVYTDDDTRYDMVTILVTLVLDTIVYEGNRTALIDLLKNVDKEKAEDIYNTVIALLTHNEKTVDMVKYNWILTDYDVNGTGDNAGKIVSPITMGATLNSSIYGPLYTRAMGEYITKFFPLFVNTWITLLGIDDGKGGSFSSLDDLLNSFIGTSIYKTELLQNIASALANAVENLKETLGDDLFNYVKEVLKRSLKVDLDLLLDPQVTTIEEGDRDGFVSALCTMFSPAAPILRWLLTDQAISLFTDRNGDDYIVLNGAKGYQDSFIPIMEALHVPADSILTQAEYEAATDRNNKQNDTAADAAMLENIVNPILDRVDEIIEDPINEIFDILPGVVYFVNSKGLDSAFKNLLNAVFQLLVTIDPVIADVEDLHKNGKVSLYPLMSKNMAALDLEELTFDSIAELLIDFVNKKVEDYGFELTGTLQNAIKELSLGVVRSFTSKRDGRGEGFGSPDYTMDYASSGQMDGGAGDKVDMATIVMRLVLHFISDPKNVIAIEKLLEGRVSGDGYKFICSLLENFQQFAYHDQGNGEGMDKIMYTVYQIFYAALNAGVATNNGLAEFNGNYSFLNQLFATSEYSFFQQLEKSFGDLLNKWTSDVVDDDEVAPKGFIKLFQKLIDFFKKILNFIKGIFG